MKGAHNNTRKKWKILCEAANLGDKKTTNVISKLIVESDKISFANDPKKYVTCLAINFPRSGLRLQQNVPFS